MKNKIDYLPFQPPFNPCAMIDSNKKQNSFNPVSLGVNGRENSINDEIN